MIRLTKEQIILLHSQLIQETGGSDGIRDENLLESAIETPFQSFGGEELYPSIQAKAVRLCYGLVKNHPMIDGNGRTSRMIMNYQLMSVGFLPVSIAKENRLEYFEALEVYAVKRCVVS